jgi:hypothetical protein
MGTTAYMHDGVSVYMQCMKEEQSIGAHLHEHLAYLLVHDSSLGQLLQI